MELRALIIWILSGIGVTIVLGYSFFVLQGLLRGPEITLTSPESGFATTSPLVLVQGTAVRTTGLTLNGSPVPLDLKGNFAEHILLGAGYNIVSVHAEDRYKRTKEIKLELVLNVPVIMSTTTATTTPATEKGRDDITN